MTDDDVVAELEHSLDLVVWAATRNHIYDGLDADDAADVLREVADDVEDLGSDYARELRGLHRWEVVGPERVLDEPWVEPAKEAIADLDADRIVPGVSDCDD